MKDKKAILIEATTKGLWDTLMKGKNDTSHNMDAYKKGLHIRALSKH